MTSQHGRNIPWLRVVRFHKEIVTRAEQNFFSFKGQDVESERWTSLVGFDPGRFDGPWRLTPEQIASQPFLQALVRDRVDSVFLGGPGYIARQKAYNNAYEPRLCTLFYIEVEIRKEEDEIVVVPKQGAWNISPLVQNLLNRSEVITEVPSEKLASYIMEATAGFTSSEPSFTQAIWRAFAEELPEVINDLRRDHPSRVFSDSPPSPWILFAPTIEYSAITRNLLNDYNHLERLLSENGDNRGGLRLLEGVPDILNDEPVDLLSIVKLNESQANAVVSILQGYPLTVISGPPGTGKSQVVVSLLMNAWARGKTVLFASNNNKAVDVVRERLEQFDSDFPIAVRAGSREKQNIEETLRRILNKVGIIRRGNRHISDLSDIQNRRQSLAQELISLQKYSVSDLPQRIDESFEAALKAYGECRMIIDRIELQEGQIRDDLVTLGVDDRPAEMIHEDLVVTEAWLSLADDFQASALHALHRNNKIQAQIEHYEKEREAVAEKLNFYSGNQPVEWGWLLTGPQPDTVFNWEKMALSYLVTVNEESLQLPPWREEYERWPTLSDAKRRVAELLQFGQQIQDSCHQLVDAVSELEDKEQRSEESLRELTDAGGNGDIDVSVELLESWRVAFSSYATLDRQFLDSFPWSQRTKLQKELKELESQLMPGFPIETWLRIGPLDDLGRRKLATLVERSIQWYRQRQAWEQAQPLSKQVDWAFQELVRHARTLQLTAIPIGRNLKGWEQMVSVCEREAVLADEATIYRRRVIEKEQIEAQLRSVADKWLSLFKDNPFGEGWLKADGLKLDGLISRMFIQPSAKSANAVLTAIRAGALRTLTTPWVEACAIQRTIGELTEEAESVPTAEYFLHEWANRRPPEAFVLESTPNTWADIPENFDLLDQLRSWLVRWNHYREKVLPAEEAIARPSMERALSRLELTVGLIPNLQVRNRLTDVFSVMKNDLYAEWPMTELTSNISRYGATDVSRRIDGLEARIARADFDLAKAVWSARLQGDSEALRSVDILEALIGKTYGRLPADKTDIFRSALRAAPIWITTAQAPQAVPLEQDLFDIVVIDEASQCTVTNLLPLVFRGKTLVVLGDDKQLPAIPTIQEAEEIVLAQKHQVEHLLYLLGHTNNDVYRTATASLPGRRADVLMLMEHYRSHPQIIGFSNRHIYLQQLELKKDPNREMRLPVAAGVHQRRVQGFASRGANGHSWVNEPEAEEVIRLLQELKTDDVRSLSIGVVTPFAAHKDYLRARLEHNEFGSDVLIDSAYGFQGDERDIIIFSPVVAKGITPGAGRWVENPPNLINVAITRAREALIVVADFDYCLRQEGLLRTLALYCNEIQLLRESSKAELELYSWMMLRGLTPHVHPKIGDIEVDFGLRTKSGKPLVIEVDGRQHRHTIESDKTRDAFLNARGCAVMRVSARDVFETPIEVLHTLSEHLNN